MAITRITAQWTGFRGSPGYSNFLFDGEFVDETGIEAAGVALRTFFNDIRDTLPAGLSVGIRGSADILDEATGEILHVTDFTPPSTAVGGDTGGYSAATGAVVNWNTNDYIRGRRVRGRTFLVPLSNGAFGGDGDLTNTALSTIRTAASALVTTTLDVPLSVWSRPRNGAGGSSHVVTGATVPDLGAVLRSRRD